MPFQFTDYDPCDFAIRRHIGPAPSEMAAMLEVVGADSLDELIDETVPAAIRRRSRSTAAPPLTEREALARLGTTAGTNR